MLFKSATIRLFRIASGWPNPASVARVSRSAGLPALAPLVLLAEIKEEFIMRKNLGAKPYTYPQPVFIIGSYGPDGTPDAMNAAWGGISDTTELSLCLSAGHKTVKNILERKASTVSMADAAHVVECDYLGVVSANDVSDKLANAGFHTTKSEFVDAPLIDELAMAVECRLVSYDPQTGHLVGEIVNVSVDESVLTSEGKVNVDKLAPIVFDSVNAAYYKLGEKVGNAFSDGQKLK